MTINSWKLQSGDQIVLLSGQRARVDWVDPEMGTGVVRVISEDRDADDWDGLQAVSLLNSYEFPTWK